MPIVFVVFLWVHPPESISARMDPRGLKTVHHSEGKQFRCLSGLGPRHEPLCSQRCSVGTRIASSVGTYPAFWNPTQFCECTLSNKRKEVRYWFRQNPKNVTTRHEAETCGCPLLALSRHRLVQRSKHSPSLDRQRL